MNQRNKKKFPNWFRVVALTGGMGSGKSTVLTMLKKKGAVVQDADAIVHDLLAHDKTVLSRIRAKFSSSVFDSNKQLIRRKLGEKIFSSKKNRVFLEKLIHPMVRKKMAMELKRQSGTIAVVDIPLLYETGQQDKYDSVIVVTASEKTRRQRLLKKGFTSIDIGKRFKAQMSLAEKEKHAQFVVNNNGTKQQTQKQINQIWSSLIRS